jgi:3-hydroxyethyl bacteriochlorophyllide a dehydrogenase
MQTAAVILRQPGSIGIGPARLRPMTDGDVVVEVEWSSISTGTERLLWSGRMPHFPGLGYPLVPGYEAVGCIAESRHPGLERGTRVFVPGSNGFEDLRGLFGASARRLVVGGDRVVPVSPDLGPRAVLLALAATAHHIAPVASQMPQLIVGHGALGRLLARLVCLSDQPPPTVWETAPRRRDGARGYKCIDPSEDECRSYERICDVSGDPSVLDMLMERLAPGGEIVLGGFYHAPVQFDFVPAFLREARLRVAAQWRPLDLAAITGLIAAGRLSLDDIITDEVGASEVQDAYRRAFEDDSCLKMVIDWRALS